jgi:hypothetical protein
VSDIIRLTTSNKIAETGGPTKLLVQKWLLHFQWCEEYNEAATALLTAAAATIAAAAQLHVSSTGTRDGTSK